MPATERHYPQEIAPPNAIITVEVDMARRRLQKHGDLYQQGGWWKLRWREDQRKADGLTVRGWSKSVTLGPSAGSGRLTKHQAERIAWDNFLSRLDQNTATPQSVATVKEFVERKFLPGHVALLKPSGQSHYRYMLAHVLPVIGGQRLRDIGTDDIQSLIAGVLAGGRSTQTARHVKNTVSAVFSHAERIGWHPGPNPASLVRLPEMVRQLAHALSTVQCQALLRALASPEREMALAMILRSKGSRVRVTPGVLRDPLESAPLVARPGNPLPPECLPRANFVQVTSIRRAPWKWFAQWQARHRDRRFARLIRERFAGAHGRRRNRARLMGAK